MEEKSDGNLPDHHVQLELCQTRPRYRQGRQLTAVKAYTINNESQHLLFYNVPALNLSSELKTLCLKYGEILKCEEVKERKLEEFTLCYHVSYKRIQSARIAKRFLDNKSFYGGILHVCYAPEYESQVEVKRKLEQRLKDVAFRNQPGPTQIEYASYEPVELVQPVPETEMRKRKNEETNEQQETVSKQNTYDMNLPDYKSIGKRKKLINIPEMSTSTTYAPTVQTAKTVPSVKRIVFHKNVNK